MAEKIFTDAAPSSARVIVNRVWGWRFGKPLVETPSNFGAQGEKPANPQLLDDLAARFITGGRGQSENCRILHDGAVEKTDCADARDPQAGWPRALERNQTSDRATRFYHSRTDPFSPLQPFFSRALIGQMPVTRRVALLVEARRKLVDRRTMSTNQLTSLLKNYYPQALHLVGDTRIPG